MAIIKIDNINKYKDIELNTQNGLITYLEWKDCAIGQMKVHNKKTFKTIMENNEKDVLEMYIVEYLKENFPKTFTDLFRTFFLKSSNVLLFLVNTTLVSSLSNDDLSITIKKRCKYFELANAIVFNNNATYYFVDFNKQKIIDLNEDVKLTSELIVTSENEQVTKLYKIKEVII